VSGLCSLGSEQAFASAQGVIANFRKLVSRRIASVQMEAIVAQVVHAERLKRVASLGDMLAGTVAG
jgi:hypothetical protein